MALITSAIVLTKYITQVLQDKCAKRLNLLRAV